LDQYKLERWTSQTFTRHNWSQKRIPGGAATLARGQARHLAEIAAEGHDDARAAAPLGHRTQAEGLTIWTDWIKTRQLVK